MLQEKSLLTHPLRKQIRPVRTIHVLDVSQSAALHTRTSCTRKSAAAWHKPIEPHVIHTATLIGTQVGASSLLRRYGCHRRAYRKSHTRPTSHASERTSILASRQSHAEERRKGWNHSSMQRQKHRSSAVNRWRWLHPDRETDTYSEIGR